MSDRTLDNDDLSSTQELVIAGIVILFFGLLYWFLNTDESIEANLEATNTKTPKISSSVVASEKNKALKTPTPTQEVATVSTAKATDNTHQATTPEATIPPVKEKSNKPVQTEIVVETQPTSGQPRTVSTEAMLPEAPIAPTKPVAPAPPEEPIAKENSVTTESAEHDNEKSTTEEVIASTSQDLLYTLPDGREVKIASSGFENTFKQAILNKTHNKPIIFDNIYFHSGSEKVKTTSDHQLKATVALLHKHPDISILLRGHTDNTGNIKSNSELSLNRANATGLALAALGINGDRIRIEGMGDTAPIASNDTEKGRKRNRRIELLIIE